MKRFFVFLLFVLFCGAAGYLLTSHLRQEPDLAGLVPADSVALVEWDDPADSWLHFCKTRMGRCLREIDWTKLLREIGLPDQRLAALTSEQKAITGFVNSPLFRQLLGHRVAAALLADSKGAVAGGVAGMLRKNLVLLVSPRRGRSTGALLNALLAGNRVTDAGTYQGVAIRRFRVSTLGVPVFAAADEDVLFFSLSTAALRRCLDLALAGLVREKTGMATSPSYFRLRHRAGGRVDLFVFLDFARIKSIFSSLGTEVCSVSSTRQVGSLNGTCEGVQRAVFFHKPLNSDVQQFASIVEFDPGRLAPFQGTIYQRKPVIDRKIANMPSDLLVYFWTNWLDLPDWWHSTLSRSSGADREAAGRIAAWVEHHTGRSLDRLLAMFGQEFGLNVVEIITSGFFPVPRICLCVEIKDRLAVRELLDTLLLGVPIQREVVADVPIVSVMAAGGLMQPSYALTDKFLILSDGRDQIEEILQPGRNMLLADPDFRKVELAVRQPANLVVFARTALLVDGMKELASWLGTIIAIRDEQSAATSKVLIDQAVLPILESMKMFRAAGILSHTAEGELVLQSTVLIEPD